MTVVVEQYEGNNHYAYICIENHYGRDVYIVRVNEEIGGQYGYPMREMYYPISDKKKAYATYRRYVRKYCK